MDEKTRDDKERQMYALGKKMQHALNEEQFEGQQLVEVEVFPSSGIAFFAKTPGARDVVMEWLRLAAIARPLVVTHTDFDEDAIDDYPHGIFTRWPWVKPLPLEQD